MYALNTDIFSADNQFINLSPGSYELIIQDADGCEFRIEISIEAAPSLYLDLGEDREIRLGETVQILPNLDSSSERLTHFIW